MSNLFNVIAVKRVWFKADNTLASESEADAIAGGYINGRSEIREILITSFGPCSESQARLAYKNWAMTSPVYHNNSFEDIRFEAAK